MIAFYNAKMKRNEEYKLGSFLTAHILSPIYLKTVVDRMREGGGDRLRMTLTWHPTQLIYNMTFHLHLESDVYFGSHVYFGP